MDQIYAYETIDPTLSGVESFLGDAGLDGEVDLLGMEAGSDDQVPRKSNNQEKVEVRHYNNESSSTALSFSSTSPRSKEKVEGCREATFLKSVSYQICFVMTL